MPQGKIPPTLDSTEDAHYQRRVQLQALQERQELERRERTEQKRKQKKAFSAGAIKRAIEDVNT